MDVSESFQRATIRFVLYGLLALLFGVSILLEVLGHVFGWSWTDNWMPNFIAEWSGIFIAAFVVERLLELERLRISERQLRPLRRVAGDSLASSIAPIVACAWVLDAGLFVDQGRSSVKRFGAFSHPLAISQKDKVEFWFAALVDASGRLSSFRRDYSALLEPQELASLDELREVVVSLRDAEAEKRSDYSWLLLGQVSPSMRDIPPIFQRLTTKPLTLDHREIRASILKIRPPVRLLSVEARLRKRPDRESDNRE